MGLFNSNFRQRSVLELNSSLYRFGDKSSIESLTRQSDPTRQRNLRISVTGVD
jgi:hypothetical protein